MSEDRCWRSECRDFCYYKPHCSVQRAKEMQVEILARELCDTYYLTVDPDRTMSDAYDKITEKTREHWRAQARLMMERGWTRG